MRIETLPSLLFSLFLSPFVSPSPSLLLGKKEGEKKGEKRETWEGRKGKGKVIEKGSHEGA